MSIDYTQIERKWNNKNRKRRNKSSAVQILDGFFQTFFGNFREKKQTFFPGSGRWSIPHIRLLLIFGEIADNYWELFSFVTSVSTLFVFISSFEPLCAHMVPAVYTIYLSVCWHFPYLHSVCICGIFPLYSSWKSTCFRTFWPKYDYWIISWSEYVDIRECFHLTTNISFERRRMDEMKFDPAQNIQRSVVSFDRFTSHSSALSSFHISVSIRLSLARFVDRFHFEIALIIHKHYFVFALFPTVAIFLAKEREII